MKKTAVGKREASASGSIHFISDSERKSYVEFINSALVRDEDTEQFLPIETDTKQIFDVIAEGVLFCKMLHQYFPESIDLSTLVTKKDKSPFERNLNHDLAIAAAVKIGASIVNIGGADLSEKKETLCLGMLWQLIKFGLLSQVAKLEAMIDETLGKVPPEQILLRWFNHHLKRFGLQRTVTNFSSDLADGECYSVLLGQIAPDVIGQDQVGRALREKDFYKRAEMVLDMAEAINCRKFVTARDIVDGNPRLNLGFVATLFLAYPAMGPTEEELKIKRLEKECSELQMELTKVTKEKEVLERKAKEDTMTFQSRIDEMEDRISALLAEIESLKKQLAEERQKNAELTKKLEESEAEWAEKEKEFLDKIAYLKQKLKNQKQKAQESQQHSDGLIAALRSEKEDALSEAQRKMLEALDKEKQAGLNSLMEAEMRAREELERIRNMLHGCQKQGFLHKQVRGLRDSYKKRFFVLKDNLLCYYHKQADAELGREARVINLDDVRVYEANDTKKSSKRFVFHLKTPVKTFVIAASTAGDRKSWMDEIKKAKKRHIGIDVVRRTSPPVSPREGSGHSPRGGALASSDSESDHAASAVTPKSPAISVEEPQESTINSPRSTNGDSSNNSGDESSPKQQQRTHQRNESRGSLLGSARSSYRAPSAAKAAAAGEDQ